jgi:hypothetical protein
MIDIDGAFEFYGLDETYKEKCYNCLKEINGNQAFKDAFKRVYDRIYFGNLDTLRFLWEIKDTDELFTKGINPFVTNLMIVSAYQLHKENMTDLKFDEEQIAAHKKRVKICFENDLKVRGFTGTRLTQMLWSVYFVRTKLIEVKGLQYERFLNDDNSISIKMHIPTGTKIDAVSVKASVKASIEQLREIFGIENAPYLCESWLLCNQIYEIINKESNIAQFHDLFDVEDSENCIDDILNYVYKTSLCEDYSLLNEETSLQRVIKKELLGNKTFYFGNGVFKLAEI